MSRYILHNTIFSEKSLTYYGTVAKICETPSIISRTSYTNIRLCCETSKGKFETVCNSSSPDNKITNICSLCDPHPDLHKSFPFEMALSKFPSSVNEKITSSELEYKYGRPNCSTHDYDLSKYAGRWQLYPNGHLRIGSKVFDQTSYCFNHGGQTKQGK